MADELKPCPNLWCASHDKSDPEIFEAHRPILMPSRASFEWAVACPVCPIQSTWFDTEAEAIIAWNTRTETRVQAAIDELVAGLAAIVDGEIERPLGKRWRKDKKPSKNDTCIHGAWMYECCEGCIDAHVLAILSRHKGEGE